MSRNWFSIGILLASLGLSHLVSAEEGVTDSTILIGQTVGLTGTVAAPVKEMNEGANAYFSIVNKMGGVNGRKIELRTMDDKFDPALAAANAEDLITRQHVFALFQGRGTPHTEGILPILATYKVPLIAPTTGAALLRQPANHWVFNIRASYQSEVERGVDEFSLIGIKSIGLLYVDDSFGQDALEGFTKAMAERKLTPNMVTTFSRVNPDYLAAANTVSKAGPQGLIIISSSNNTLEMIKALRTVGSTSQIMILSVNSSGAFIKELGAASEGVIISQVMPAPNLVTTPLGEEFQKAAKATGATLSYAGMEGFVNAKLLVEGLRRAGRNLSREGFVRALETMKRVDLGGVVITYDEKDHSGSKFVELTIVGKGGRYVR
jgi:branched-chain amino acid transport system substrate-binding protein